MKTVIIGLTGPTGAGKSTAALKAAEMGINVIDCDSLSRTAVQRGSKGLESLIGVFGKGIVDKNGELNRKKLAETAFSSREKTELLNKTLLPYIVDLAKARIKENTVNMLDAPTLFESGLDGVCDITVAVLSNEQSRFKRITLRDNISESAARIRMEAGKNDDFYRQRADIILLNNGAADEFLKEAESVFKDIAGGKYTMSEKNSASKELKEKLFYKKKNGLLKVDESVYLEALHYCEGYKSFLNAAKTEREAAAAAISMAKGRGFEEFERGKSYKAGDKVYFNNRGKTVAFAVIGKKSVEDGLRITAAHIDSPRLDLKPNPLYEELELALFKTHYYGGIRKYQWPAVPLALHGVFAKKDGSVVNVKIGEDENDPKFVVNDLLPHLAAEQSKRTLSEGIKGEELNILIGSMPFKDDEGSELVKLNILKILNEKYGVTEEDFLSAELEMVPAAHSCDIGFDRSLIGSYGQDDRVCAYPALTAVLDVADPEYTALAILTDKEEIGSDGNTGLNSDFLLHTVGDLARSQGADVTVALRNSQCLSADVNAGMDPTFQDVMEKRNASLLNYGVCVTKYTGARGKAGTSDASAEYVAKIRAMLDNAGIVWQTGELGKVDAGGGGTVAMYIANLGVDVVDLGVPVLSMHSPFETTAKLDVYMCFKAMYEFMK